MPINLLDLGLVHLVCGKTDMRQGIDSLAYLIKSKHPSWVLNLSILLLDVCKESLRADTNSTLKSNIQTSLHSQVARGRHN